MISVPKLHILCIEDASGEARLIEKYLTRMGYTMDLVPDGETGLAQAEKVSFDVILIDLQLPGITGLEVLQILLAREPLRPVIVVTGHGNEETAVAAMKLGAKDYIVKDVQGGFIKLLPIVIEQAMRQQRTLLEKQRAEQSMERGKAILEAVAFAAEKLLQTPSWKSHIEEILARLGQATGVSRVYLAGNGKMGNSLVIQQCYEWVAKNVVHRTPNYIDRSYAEIGLSEWLTLFEHGQPVHGLASNMPGSMGEHLYRYGVLSIIIFPIFTGDSWWGFIGFDDCAEEHIWDKAEIDALRTAANILGTALQRHQTEATLYQAQKLESIGLLAGGVAHDFNNLLAGILGQTSLALFKLPAGAAARENLNKAIQTAEQATLLVQQLLGYAGKGNYQIQPVNLNDLIQGHLGLLETILRKQARLHLDLMPNLPSIEVDRSQMQQVVMNLIINAAEAIEGSYGDVWIITRLYEANITILGIAQSTLPPGQYLCLEVRDNGQGIEASVMERMFDPFFTTKANGRGLGLSATLGIIQAHGGVLQVESRVGQGSRFRVFLPISAQVVANPPTAWPLTNSINGCVLLIDDEQVVRQAVQEALEILGATVLTAENGPSGIDLYRQHQQTIDLVLLDMQMPGMNGSQTFRYLQNINPQVKVILSSGYGESEAIRDLSKLDNLTFLQKPYRFEELMAVVQAVLLPEGEGQGR